MTSDNDYSDLMIVAEDQWYSRKQEKTTVCVYNTRWEVYEVYEDLGDLTNNDPTMIAVECEEILPKRENCHAEVLFIYDNALEFKGGFIRVEWSLFEEAAGSVLEHSEQRGARVFIGTMARWRRVRLFAGATEKQGHHRKNELTHLKLRNMFSPGDEFVKLCDAASGDISHYSVVIRILEDKQKILKEFDNRSAADVTFVVNGEECKGDRKYLAGVSPVFNAMLYGKFAEAQQNRIVLEGIESAKIFKDFLLAVSPLRVQPNPSNVVALLKLAHQYDVPFLTRNCEDHLLRCYEIPIAERILLAGKYGLDSLKIRTTQEISDDDLKKIFKEKQVQLREPESSFLFDAIADRMEKMQVELLKIQKE